MPGFAALSAPAYIAKTENHETSLYIARTYPLAWNEVEAALENLKFEVDEDDFDGFGDQAEGVLHPGTVGGVEDGHLAVEIDRIDFAVGGGW